MSAFVEWQTRIRQHRNVLSRIQPEVPDCIVHFFRPGRAVDPDHVDIERFERGQGRADLCARAAWSRIPATSPAPSTADASLPCASPRARHTAPTLACSRSCAVSTSSKSTPPSISASCLLLVSRRHLVETNVSRAMAAWSSAPSTPQQIAAAPWSRIAPQLLEPASPPRC